MTEDRSFPKQSYHQLNKKSMIPPDKTGVLGAMVPIYEGLSRETADSYGLVLSSANLSHRMEKTARGWQIRVPEAIETKAVTTIETYLAENDPADAAGNESTWPITRTFAGVWIALILLGAHLVFTSGGQAISYRAHFGASAEKILNGEWYRLATALFLHADGLHLVGNVIGMGLFATAVCSTAGFGAGGLMILVAGMGGNLLNALLIESGHHAIGASTAVFGAVGITAAHQFIVNWRQTGRRFKAWIPLGGGLALLAMTGSGANTDLTAHFFGLVAGFLLGLVFSASRLAQPGKATQSACMLLAALLVVTSFAV